jgi:glycerate kinase
MPVTIAENVNTNVTEVERQHIRDFVANPVANGQAITVKVSGITKNQTVRHTTYGARVHTATIFYTRTGTNNYAIVGVGSHSGTKGGKTTYSALWNGRGESRVTVTIQ